MEKILQKILQVLSPQELATFLQSVRNDLSPADFDELVKMISGMPPKQQGQQPGQPQQQGQGGPQAKEVAEAILKLVKEGHKIEAILKKLKGAKIPEAIIQEALAIVKQTIEQGQGQQQQGGGQQQQPQQQQRQEQPQQQQQQQ